MRERPRKRTEKHGNFGQKCSLSQVRLAHILLTNFYLCFTGCELVYAKQVWMIGVDKAWLQNLVVANQVFSGKLQNKVITYKSWFTS